MWKNHVQPSNGKVVKEEGFYFATILSLTSKLSQSLQIHYIKASLIYLSKYTTSSVAESSSKQLHLEGYQTSLSNKQIDLSLHEAWSMPNQKIQKSKDKVP